MSRAVTPSLRSSLPSHLSDQSPCKPAHVSKSRDHAPLGCSLDHPVPVSNCEGCVRLRDDICHMQKEKEEALKDLRESFQKQLAETAINRRHLEEEHIARLRRTMQQQRELDLQKLRVRWEMESMTTVRAACEETRREMEEEREQALRAHKEAAQAEFKEQLQDALSKVAVEEKQRLEQQREVMNHKHAEELRLLQEKICNLKEQLEGVEKQKMDYENHFKELQLNYKRFIDLTDSGLHSDYLLRLIRLGEPPGYAHHAVQTDDVINMSH
ncbi:uncharacterized protein O3C94_008499 [Discoglossus pictus]